MGKWIEQIVLKRRSANGQLTHEAMLNIFSYKGNATQNYIEISSHPSQNVNQEKQQMLVKMGRGEGTLIHCWWEGKPVQPLWKSVWRFFKNQKQTYLMTLPYHFWAYICKSVYNRDTCTPIFIAALLTTVKLWNHSLSV
jgi:hypothetical protein